MKRVFLLTPLALAAMAGCAPAPNQIQAGQWEFVIEQESIDIPGAPPEMLAMARAEVGRVSRSPRCLTEEQARDFLQLLKGGQPPNCTSSDEKYADGQVRLRVNCTAQPGPGGQGGGQQGTQLSLDGNFSRTTFNTRVSEQRPNPSGANNGPVRVTTTFRGRRLGECPAGSRTPTLPGQPSQL